MHSALHNLTRSSRISDDLLLYRRQQYVMYYVDTARSYTTHVLTRGTQHAGPASPAKGRSVLAVTL